LIIGLVSKDTRAVAGGAFSSKHSQLSIDARVQALEITVVTLLSCVNMATILNELA
jgi:hypothetical protein